MIALAGGMAATCDAMVDQLYDAAEAESAWDISQKGARLVAGTHQVQASEGEARQYASGVVRFKNCDQEDPSIPVQPSFLWGDRMLSVGRAWLVGPPRFCNRGVSSVSEMITISCTSQSNSLASPNHGALDTGDVTGGFSLMTSLWYAC